MDNGHFKSLLEEERGRVVAAIENLHRENPGSMEDETDETPHDNHLADMATITYDREMSYSLEENSEHVLAAIDAALRRIEEGTYGICDRCGKPIGEERLEAVPWVTLCIDDKRKQEGG
jgi:RNA polymerase-binding protein DksA